MVDFEDVEASKAGQSVGSAVEARAQDDQRPSAGIDRRFEFTVDRARPEVSGQEGLDAVSLALQVLEAIRSSPAAGC